MVCCSKDSYLEGVSCVAVISMSGADTSLLADQSSYHLEFFAVNVAISVQVEHSKGNLKMATGSCETEFRLLNGGNFVFVQQHELTSSQAHVIRFGTLENKWLSSC